MCDDNERRNIEAQARHAALAEVRRGVDELRFEFSRFPGDGADGDTELGDLLRAVLAILDAAETPQGDTGSEYGRLLAERDWLIADGADPAELDMPLPPDAAETP